MSDGPGFDWPALLRLGLRDLGLRPGAFWSLTPTELMLMLGRDAAQAPMNRARLEELARAFPDPGLHMNEGEDDGRSEFD